MNDVRTLLDSIKVVRPFLHHFFPLGQKLRPVVCAGYLVFLRVRQLAINDFMSVTSHFKKLLGYALCKYFYHVTYVKRGDIDGILQHLRTTCKEPSIGIQYCSQLDLVDDSSRPRGIRAKYKIGERDITVVFLVLDLAQETQRNAAASQ